jgi:hypothetical protein
MATTNNANFTETSKKILEIVETFTCLKEYNEMKSFFSNSSNAQAMFDVIELYGLPPKNTPAYHTTFGGWHDFCDWDKGIYAFYLAAVLFKNYPNVTKDTSNCDKINGLLSDLETELVSADKKYVADRDDMYHTVQLKVILDRKAYYNGIYNSVSCDDFLAKKLAIRLFTNQVNMNFSNNKF